jgi:glycosyltransferase involved in cell wall biosynthesis
MLEAMASGLPIIASELAAHRDFIQHRQTCWLTESREDFANALIQLEDHQLNESIGQAARNWTRQEVGSWDDCAARYSALYARLMESP